MKSFIGVDIGTTGIRAGVYDEEFALLGTGNGRSIIRKGPGGEIIQEADEIYTESAKAVSEAIRNAGVNVKDIACISFDGQMAGVMAIDEKWNAVTPYDSWLDTRCAEQVASIKNRAGRLVVEKTGNIASYNHGPKILWWKENEKEVYRRIKSFIQPSAYVAGRLCGLDGKDAFIDWTFLHFSGYADNKNLKWDEELTAIFGIDISKLPRIVSPLTVIGYTTKKESESFGIPPGVAVAAGCGDTASCFVGTGAVEAGLAVDVAGTASVLALTTDKFLVDFEGMVYTARSVYRDTWYSMSYINGGGLNLEWFRETFCPESTFDDLNRAIEGLTPGSDGLIFIPHLEGRAYPNNPAMRGQWKGFTRGHNLGHFFKSILEGIAYEYALYMERILEALKERRKYTIRGVGGGSKSRLWNQIKADVLDCEYTTINRKDISTLGQALIAASATGAIKDIRETVKNIIRIEETFYPDERNHVVYLDFIDRYKKMLLSYE